MLSPTGALWLLLLSRLIGAWSHRSTKNVNLSPVQTIAGANLGLYFADQDQRDTAFFKVLAVERQSVLVGTRNAVLNISLSTMSVQKSLEWPPTADDVDMCQMKGKNEENCHNFIRLLFKQPKSRLIVCGTNAFQPACRQYRISSTGEYQIVKDIDGIAVVPFDPRQNTTAVYLSESDELYSATVADFSATLPLVFRKPLSGPTTALRTPRNDLKCLNDPQFVASFAEQNSVYFWFRETAAEYNNCGTAVFSRVARVCKSDQGDYRTDTDTWTSFLKARLNCSLPGDVPFYFNEIQSASEVVMSDQHGGPVSLVYAVFNTPSSALRASAVCAFNMDDVRSIFETGPFKAQRSSSSAWLPIYKSSLPEPRPGDCSANSKALADDVISFVRRHNLMYDAVPNYFDQPLIVDTNGEYQFTAIAVHSSVTTVGKQRYDVLFVGTDSGSVLKFVNVEGDRRVNTVLVETVGVFPSRSPVRSLKVVPASDGDKAQVSLLISTDSELKLMPVHHCANRTSCRTCVQLQDPYCAWDLINNRCVVISLPYVATIIFAITTFRHWQDGKFAQSVADGQSSLCLNVVSESSDFFMNELAPAFPLVDSPSIYTAECMTIAIIITLALASTVAFFVGYRFALWKLSFDAVPGFDSPLRKNVKGHNDRCEAYMPHLPVSKTVTNGSVNVSLPFTEPKGEKNVLTLNNGTLPRDYKTRKVYV
ncbi:Semaphorin-1A [Trichuris trichiura]|uniref:Semaphorin-2A n=1 Tax=Trichuris trichiura TaxID=36087 RepID=A0A077Z2K9_TRITR|nr:Semaphorin-1A [Trichuris trichiura]